MELRERITALGRTVAYQNLEEAAKQMRESPGRENAQILAQKYSSFHKLFYAAIASHGKMLRARGVQLASEEGAERKAREEVKKALEIARDALPVYFRLRNRVKEARASGPAE